MKLVIDTRNGIAGDIISAGLIGLGANEEKMISNMDYAGNFLGKTKIEKLLDGNSIKLDIQLESEKEHLLESKAIELLSKITNDLNMDKTYTDIARNILKVLCEAEKNVHSSEQFKFPKLKDNLPKEQSNEAILHEAKDILIDIIGFCTALQELGIKEIFYLDHINVGNGLIKFSHGTFNVPTPATEYILNKFNLKWKKSHVPHEMATPTGTSILAGSNAKRIRSLKDNEIIKKAHGKGTRDLLPVAFYLLE